MAGKSKAGVRGKTAASDTQSFEAKLWEACEAQRGSVNASRYKHPVLGLVLVENLSTVNLTVAAFPLINELR